MIMMLNMNYSVSSVIFFFFFFFLCFISIYLCLFFLINWGICLGILVVGLL